MTKALISKDLKIISLAKKEINFILLMKLLLPREAMNLEKSGKTEPSGTTGDMARIISWAVLWMI